MARATFGGELSDQIEHEVLRRDPGVQRPLDPQFERLRLGLPQRLRGEHVLHLARADAEGERPQGAVRGGVAVAADDRHARLGDSQFRADHVHDALIGITQIEQAHAELEAVVAERVDLLLRDRIGDRKPPVGRGDVVVGCGEGGIRPPHAAAGQSQPLEGLRAGHFVDEVPVDVEQRQFAGRGADDVGVPDLVEQRAGRGGHRGRRLWAGMEWRDCHSM